MRVPIGAFYVDETLGQEATQRPDVINQVPEPGATGIPAANGLVSSPIHLTIVDPGLAGLALGTLGWGSRSLGW